MAAILSVERDQNAGELLLLLMGGDRRKDGSIEPIGGEELERVMVRLIGSAAAPGPEAGLLVVGIDDLDSVTKRWGETAATTVRRWAAAMIASVLRSGDILARHRDDGFAVLCRGTSAEQALALAYRIQTRLSQHPCEIRETRDAHFFTPSIGVAHREQGHGSDATSFLAAATRASEAAKAAGGNCIRKAA